MSAVRGARRRAPYLNLLTRGGAGRIGAVAALVLYAFCPRAAFSQTPSPLQEWQYSAGVVLFRMFEPNQPDWRSQIGLAAEPRPAYEGARNYRTLAGPVIDVRYRDIYFASTGEGIGVNFLRGENYLAGISVGYDFGRRESDDLTHLKGLGNIEVAPVFKLFGSYVVSKQFPLVIRADVRRFVGGAGGWVGDLEAYAPLPGSSKKFVMFAGPSVTFADSTYMNSWFGVNAAQAAASGYRQYDASAGLKSAGFGITMIWFVDKHWFVTADGALKRLLGSAAHSPITQTKTDGVCDVSINYQF